MSKFLQPGRNLERLVDNSFRAISEGSYESDYSNAHDSLSLSKAIRGCPRAPLITEVKFSSPSQGKIRSKSAPSSIAGMMVSSGAIALSVLTQPYLFEGSLEYLARIRKQVSVPLLMKDIIVSRVQIDAGKNAGADCVLLIMAVFERNLAEESLESLKEYATKKGLQVLVEVHTAGEITELLKSRPEIVGINNRDLDTLKVDIQNTERLLAGHAKGKSLVVSESGISTAADIQYLKKVGADAFLVGTSIMESENVGEKVRELYTAL